MFFRKFNIVYVKDKFSENWKKKSHLKPWVFNWKIPIYHKNNYLLKQLPLQKTFLFVWSSSGTSCNQALLPLYFWTEKMTNSVFFYTLSMKNNTNSWFLWSNFPQKAIILFFSIFISSSFFYIWNMLKELRFSRLFYNI